MKAPPLCKGIEAASALLRILGNPSRLAIICLLLDGERSVMELEVALGIRQPTLSQQLTALRHAKLIVGRRAHRNVVYRVCDCARRPDRCHAAHDVCGKLLPASALLTVRDGELDRARAVPRGGAQPFGRARDDGVVHLNRYDRSDCNACSLFRKPTRVRQGLHHAVS